MVFVTILVDAVNRFSGDYSVGVPPLPIPNREVKPNRADGTAFSCGRVGRRHFLREESFFNTKKRFSSLFVWNYVSAS